MFFFSLSRTPPTPVLRTSHYRGVMGKFAPLGQGHWALDRVRICYVKDTSLAVDKVLLVCASTWEEGR